MPRQAAVVATVRRWVTRGQGALTFVDLPGRRGPAAGHNPIQHPIGRKSTRDPTCSYGVYARPVPPTKVSRYFSADPWSPNQELQVGGLEDPPDQRVLRASEGYCSPVRTLPTGTITFFFTDIEGSTRLWEHHPEAMGAALQRHDSLLRSVIESKGGYVFKTVGDAFCAAFASAGDAVEAGIAAQQGLQAERWPEHADLRVRMALHTGKCEERDGDYFGPTVNRTARLEATAHGRQVVLSQATAVLVRDRLPDSVELTDLGSHRLKDLARPEQIFQLNVHGLEVDFPPLRSLDNPALPNNLPAQPASFVGRTREAAEVRLLVEDHRLVTLTGAGGSGKTRLALQVAAELLDGSGDGVWLVELAPISDESLVATTMEDVLGISQATGPPRVRCPGRCPGTPTNPDRPRQLRAPDRVLRQDRRHHTETVPRGPPDGDQSTAARHRW